MMNVNCPRCQRQIPTDNLNMDHMAAKCDPCGTLFNFAGQMTSDSEWFGTSEVLANAPRPEKVRQEHDGIDLILRWKWLNASIIFMIPFAIFWNMVVAGFVFFSSPFAVGSNGERFDLFSLIPLMAMPHVLIGIGLIYYVLCMLLNQTKVSMRRSELLIQHTPLPWPGMKNLSSDHVKQLYTKERVGGKNGSRISYEVHLINHQGKHSKLLTGLDSAEHALYVEQEIEKYLNIQNRPVRGAYA
ncbi:MAG: hypothetical protein AAF702_07105 [Chloroflexota bacterium]